jgi:hypothetical protein
MKKCVSSFCLIVKDSTSGVRSIPGDMNHTREVRVPQTASLLIFFLSDWTMFLSLDASTPQ